MKGWPEGNEAKRRVQSILEESAENLARRDRERAQELEATRRNRFAKMLAMVAIFMIGFAAFMRPSHPRDAAVILLGSFLILLIAALYTDSGNARLRRLARELRRRWSND